MESSKKQRNKRNPKEKQEPASTKSTTNKESVTVNPKTLQKEGEPQPQRAQRRPRNEQAAPSDSKSANVLQISSTPIITEKKLKPQEPVVDHSNLKRETEEIAKLNQKFTKRKITSNWHRYSAPERSEDAGGEDVSAPADFTDLLQVPVSRGGHLTLKDEQEWSSGSGTALSGYFALDLKKLNQSLACIPLYDQLHIPKNVFTVEEIKEFDDLARKNKKSLNPESEIINSTNTSNPDFKEEPFVIDIGNQTKQNVDSHTFTNLEICEIDKITIDKLVEEGQDVTSISNEPKINDNDKTINDSNFTNLLLDSIENKSEQRNTTEIKISKSKVKQNGSLENRNVYVQPSVVVPFNKSNNVLSDNVNKPKLDDDDDLDFLLSLTTPVPTHEKIGYQPSSTVKDSGKDAQLPADEKSSELDDWLDSVLED